MRVEIKEGGDGVACWNRDAIAAYAASIDAREAALGDANPDLVITPGLVKCYGCEVLEYDMGTRCTAELTRTLYAVRRRGGTTAGRRLRIAERDPRPAHPDRRGERGRPDAGDPRGRRHHHTAAPDRSVGAARPPRLAWCWRDGPAGTSGGQAIGRTTEPSGSSADRSTRTRTFRSIRTARSDFSTTGSAATGAALTARRYAIRLRGAAGRCSPRCRRALGRRSGAPPTTPNSTGARFRSLVAARRGTLRRHHRP